MNYTATQFQSLIGIKGLSEQLLTNHFKLYEGYVANTNRLIDELGQLTSQGKADTPAFAELTRRFGWEFNGMRLHELYFENLVKDGSRIDEHSALMKQIVADFSSFENWRKEFCNLAVIRGIGWVILYFDPIGNRLLNTWINEHDTGHLSGCLPILVMDVFEHAYMLDFGIKKADYVAVFMDAIHWKVAENRFLAVKKQNKDLVI